MGNQLIISVGREFGSGGHEIAVKLSEIFDVPLYDHNLLDEMAASKSLGEKEVKELKNFDEGIHKKLLSRTVRGMNNSPAQNVAYMQFDFLEKKAKNGESFVVVGRCSESILRGNKGLVSIFILGDMDKKIERVSKLYNLSPSRAEAFIIDKDKRRKIYHNSYCKGKWGDSRNYDFSINSSKLGIDKTVEIIVDYIKERQANM